MNHVQNVRCYFLKVKKHYLLLLACLVWTIAGANIVRIGFEAYSGYLTAFNVFLSAVVFAVFQFFIFGRLVKKHTKRIIAYEERQWFIKFFDIKSFIIMAIMMTGGIWLRASGVAPERFIAVFYSGLGVSLLLAGILFGVHFLKNINPKPNEA